MTPLLNRPAIKAQARDFIRENTRWGKMILATLAVYLLGGCFSITLNFKFGYNNESVGSFGSMAVSYLIIPFMVAIAGYYLNQIRGFNPEWKSLYKEAFDHYGKYFATGFLVNLFTALWSMLFIIPGIVKMFDYSQAHYIIHDNPNLKASEAIEISKRMTNGYKADLFLLYLSFFGWFLLSLFTGGILFIYVLPYLETTAAMYYENLKQNAIDQKIIAPEAFGFMQPSAAAPQSDFNGYGAQGGFNAQPPYNGYPYNSAPQGGFPNAPQAPNPYENAGITPEDTFKPDVPPQAPETFHDTPTE